MSMEALYQSEFESLSVGLKTKRTLDEMWRLGLTETMSNAVARGRFMYTFNKHQRDASP